MTSPPHTPTGARAACALVSLVAVMFGFGPAAAVGQEDKAAAARSGPNPMPAVFNIERPRDTDRLLLVNGDSLVGTVLNPHIRVRTAYGQIQFEERVLAAIDLNAGANGLQSVITVNGNRFSGFLEEASFTVQPATGDRVEVRREKIARVLFRVRPGEFEGLPRGRGFRLRNGDWLSGRLLADPLSIVTARGPVPVRLAALASAAFDTHDLARTTITLRSGDVLEGRLELEDLPIALDVGPEIRLYSGAVDRIEDSAGGEKGDSVVPPLTAPAAVSTGAAADSNPTNREGLVWIPAGEFIMGSPTDEPGRDPDEGPQTRVIIPRGFWMGRCEVTQAEYQQLTGTNPSNATEEKRRPVEKVNWYEAMDYCAKLTRRTEAAGQLPRGYVYRLPTEAEWDYACRAGTTTRFSHGDDKGYVQLSDYAWFTRNSESMTHPVGTRRPNPWGLLDMHGNVWEWCLDRRWDGALPGGCVTNVALPADGTLRVARGGSWLYEGASCRSANRDDYSPSNRCSDVGFRVVLAPVEP